MKRNKQGQVLVLVALAIFVLLGLAALGIDAGYMYSVRHELQRCADAGALAGASAFRETGMNSDDSTVTALAAGRATDYATRDKCGQAPAYDLGGRQCGGLLSSRNQQDARPGRRPTDGSPFLRASIGIAQ